VIAESTPWWFKPRLIEPTQTWIHDVPPAEDKLKNHWHSPLQMELDQCCSVRGSQEATHVKQSG
jgi:hypothetical protein